MIDKFMKDVKKSSELYTDIPQSIQGEFMNEQQQMEERLWDFIDGLAVGTEKSTIEELIVTNLEWKEQYHKLIALNQLILSSELEEPPLRFTKNVMEDIAKFHVAPATRSYINKSVIAGIFGFFIVIMLGFIIYGFSQVNFSNTGSHDILSQYDLSKRIDVGKLFNNAYTNIFILINVILGLVLMDLYLQRKKDKISHEKA